MSRIRNNPNQYAPSTRQQMGSRMDIDADDLSLLYLDEPEVDDPHETKHDDLLDPDNVHNAANESVKYSPAIGVKYTTTSHPGPDVTDMSQVDVEPDTMLSNDVEEEEGEEPETVSSILDYYTEAALSSAERKKIENKEFGLPRTRQYPLHDEAHIKQAVRMFGHCKDPNDRKTLAANIFKKAAEKGIELNIGKNNPLHEYLPKKLQESTTNDDTACVVFGLEKTMEQRTREDIIREHMRINANYYNLVFYGGNFLRAIKQLEEFTFFDYFYPNFRTHNLYQRLHATCGGLAMDREIYKLMKIRYPLETDFSIPLGDYECTDDENNPVELYINMNVNDTVNWFKTATQDVGHYIYCLRLYSVLGAIILDPNFSMDQLSAKHQGLLLDWSQRVQYHYDIMKDNPVDSPEYLENVQALFDLCWSFTDDPSDTDVIVANVAAMCDQMAMAEDMVVRINEDSEFLDKSDCAGYLIRELGLEDDLFLLPNLLEYPIINKASVRMAMDKITQVEKEYPNEIKRYTKNLNQKYKELGCTFSISVDHPYAKYADTNIINHMTQVLMEGDTAVKDDGTSSGKASPVEDGPWYIDNDTNDAVTRNLLDNKELGPNDKTKPPVDYTRHYSVF